MPTALLTDTTVMEVGWELMSWHAYVRKCAADKKYDKVVVSTTKGREVLYQDFATDILTHQVDGYISTWKMRTVRNPQELARAKSETAKMMDTLKRTGYQVTQIRMHKPIETSLQKFIRFGDKDRAAKAGRRYDIVLHARNKDNPRDYFNRFNWSQAHWNEIGKWLASQKLHACCIGTHKNALAVEGVKDLRGLSMPESMDVLAAADFIVGPTSGAMHMASLCGTPHLVWTAYAGTCYGNASKRYTQLWNPLDTSVRQMVAKPFGTHWSGGWPKPDDLKRRIIKAMGEWGQRKGWKHG